MYLDPTAGGVLVQVLMGGFAGVAVVAGLLWRRLRHRPAIRRGFRKTPAHRA